MAEEAVELRIIAAFDEALRGMRELRDGMSATDRAARTSGGTGLSVGQRMASGFNTAGSAVQSLGRNISGVGRVLTIGLTAPMAGLVGLVGGLSIRGGISRLMGLENAEQLLDQMGLSTEEVTFQMDAMLDAVKGTAFALDDGAAAVGNLVSAGVELEIIPELIGQITDAAAFGNAPLNEVAEIWQRIQNNGRVANAELTLLTQRNIPAYAVLAEALGVTTGEVRELASAGEISADEFFTAWSEGAKGFGEDSIAMEGAAKSMGDTTEGAAANMRTAMSRFGATLLKDIFPLAKVVFGAIGEGFDLLGEKFGPMVKEFTESEAFDRLKDNIAGIPELMLGIADGVVKFGETFVDVVIPAISQAVEWFRELSPAVKDALPMIAGIAAALGPAMLVVGPLVSGLGGLIKGIGGLATVLPGLGLLSGPVGIVLGLIAAIVATSPELQAALMDAFGSIMEAFAPLVEALLPVLEELIAALIPVVVELVEAFVPVIEELLPIIIEQIELFTPLLVATAEALAFVIEWLAPFIGWLAQVAAVLTPVALLVQAFSGDFEGLGDTIGGVTTEALTAIGLFVQGVTTWFTNLGTTIGMWLLDVWNLFVLRWNQILAFVTGVVTGIVFWVTTKINQVRTIIGNVLGTIQAIWTGAWNAVLSVVSTITGAIQTVVSTAIGIVRGVIDGVRTTLTNVGNAFKGLYNKVVEWLGKARDFVAGVGEKIRAGLNALNPFARSSPSLVDDVEAGVKAINKAYEKIDVSSVADKVDDMRQTVGASTDVPLTLGELGKMPDRKTITTGDSKVDLGIDPDEERKSNVARYLRGVITDDPTSDWSERLPAEMRVPMEEIGDILAPMAENLSQGDITDLSRYLAMIVDDGDYLNDWLTHLPADMRAGFQQAGQQLAALLGHDGDATRTDCNDKIAARVTAGVAEGAATTAAVRALDVRIGAVEAEAAGINLGVGAVGGAVNLLPAKLNELAAADRANVARALESVTQLHDADRKFAGGDTYIVNNPRSEETEESLRKIGNKRSYMGANGTPARKGRGSDPTRRSKAPAGSGGVGVRPV